MELILQIVVVGCARKKGDRQLDLADVTLDLKFYRPAAEVPQTGG
ncbi:hypothetical protein [Roseiconus nitratireducens]|nr:hypothetical protein [Roseiconus nitratireducens]